VPVTVPIAHFSTGITQGRNLKALPHTSTTHHPSFPVSASMPGPGAKRQKPKPKKSVQPPFVSLTDNPISTFANDIDHEEGWHIIVNMLCKHLQLPGMLRARLSSDRLLNRMCRSYDASGIEEGPCRLYANIRPHEHGVQQSFGQREGYRRDCWDMGQDVHGLDSEE